MGGTRVNDLPMKELQQEWNKSVCTLLSEKATRPPEFQYEPETHKQLLISMSSAAIDLYPPMRRMSTPTASTIRISSEMKGKVSLKIGGSSSRSSSEGVVNGNSDPCMKYRNG